MNLLEAVQQRVNTVAVGECVDRAQEIVRSIERLSAEHLPAWLPDLLAFVCLHNEELLRWSISGTPQVFHVTAQDGLKPTDYAG